MVVSSFDLYILVSNWCCGPCLVGAKAKDPDSSSIRRSYRTTQKVRSTIKTLNLPLCLWGKGKGNDSTDTTAEEADGWFISRLLPPCSDTHQDIGCVCMSLDCTVRPLEKVSALCRTMMYSVHSDKERRALGHHSRVPRRCKKTQHLGPKQWILNNENILVI